MMSVCGSGTPLSGAPGAFGETLPATQGGTQFMWPGILHVDGGEYRLCWCSVINSCTNPAEFSTDIGALVVTGPVSGVAATCVSGRRCAIADITGVYLQDGDSVMVLTACGGGLPIDGFPNGAKTTTGALQGREHSWGEAKIFPFGGDYFLCWCAKGATCLEASDHRKQLGTLRVPGPAGNFMRACGTFEACTWTGFTGTDLNDGDRIMLLRTCGEGPAIPGFPNAGIAVASGGGADYAFGTTDNIVRAGGAEYAMCWCQPDAEHVCSGPANFLTHAGLLIISGAANDHDIACVQGYPCKLLDFRGVGLTDGDKIKVLFECGTGAIPSNWPNSAVAVASDGGTSYLTWQADDLQVQYGNYRICWCKNGWTCPDTTPDGFVMDAGALRVVGINPGQSKSCHSQAPCRIDGFAGNNLRSGDLMKILTACGTGQEVEGFPNNGTSLPATSSGSSFSWGVVDTVQAAVGTYKMCWCPFGNADGCSDTTHFVSEAGLLTIRGPQTLGFNATCVANQQPSCVVGPIEDGFGLSYGSDRVILVSSDGICGASAADPAVAGGAAGKQVGVDKFLQFSPEELPYGGSWKLCYCAGFDSPLDQEAQDCVSEEDFTATAGFLTVAGAFPGQVINCTRNEACEFNLPGYSLNAGVHKIAIRDEGSGSCGDFVTIDTATRRRRDVAANPYTPTGVTQDGELAFAIEPIQALDAFVICFCAPSPGGGLCSASSLSTYHQTIGVLDVRGATPNQQFSCGRGGRCTLEITGRGLGVSDRVKIVNSTTLCSGEPQETGFFKSLLLADPAPATSSTLARFSLGQVTAGGIFKVCYCANLDSCNSLAAFNHQAGELEIEDPLLDVILESSTVASVTVQVTSTLDSTSSYIRCAISEYEPSYLPNGADIANGIAPIGLGQGQATSPTQPGANYVEMFFKTFVKPLQQYRVWCVEGSALSFILPQTPGGILIFTPADIEAPRLRVFPSFLWPQASFYAELYNVFSGAVAARRLSTSEVRVQTSASPFMCNGMTYDSAVAMQVEDAGTPGQNDARLRTIQQLEASALRRYICFFASPLATGIALVGDDRLVVQSQVPGFAIQRLDGLILQRFYRGLLLRVNLENSGSSDGLMHWTPQADFDVSGCATASRAPPVAQGLSGGQTSYFTTEASAGFYALCFLGVASEGGTAAPMNSIGSFELATVISSVGPAADPPSSRSLLRLKIEVRMPGTVTCIARKQAGTVVPGDFSAGILYEGRGSLDIPPVLAGMDPEFPREFTLEVPLVEYQRDTTSLRVWCLHSLADSAPFPESSEGSEVQLQAQDIVVTPDPLFLWTGASFRLSLANTPPVGGKLLGLHRPALPFGWSSEVALVDGLNTLRYISPGGQAQLQHPRYTEWLAGTPGIDLCLGANTSAAKSVDIESFSETSEWFTADAEGSFVCFWASPSSFPHFAGKLDIRAQPPERLLQVVGQFKSFVYRGAALTLQLRHGSATGGRLLVLKKETFDAFGGFCQDMTIERRLSGSMGNLSSEEAQATWPTARALQVTDPVAASDNCTSAPRKTTDLKLIDAEAVFPSAVWGVSGADGTNCSRDYRIYWSPDLEMTSILGNKNSGRYLLVTSNASVLTFFVPKIRLLSVSNELPQSNEVVVHKDFTTIDASTAQQFVASTADCSAKVLLDPASPMYEEGAENLPISQYLLAALYLEGFNFYAVAYMPDVSSVIEREVVCNVFQPPAPPPPRMESVFDIDKPGFGRTVSNGQVVVPALVNGTGSFLHTEPLGDYVVCYAGDEQDTTPIFNPIGPIFPSLDVLTDLFASETNASTSLAAYLNVTSQIRGVVRCVALLTQLNAPQEPSAIFVPDQDSSSYLGASDLIQFDLPGSHQIIEMRLQQSKVGFIAPAFQFLGAPPSLFVWCAHDGSTVVYPSSTTPIRLDIQARQPPSFIYKQFNVSITSVDLTLQLEFTPLVAEFSELDFPRNYYDQVEFRARPSLPAGLNIDVDTGAISGIPILAGNFQRSIVAISRNPPREAASFDLQILVKDVLGLRFTSASADNMLLSIQPRSTNIFRPQKAFLLARKRTSPFTDTPDEFFCIDALRDIPFRNISEAECSIQDEVCCCASYILLHMPVQDIRIRTADCGFEATERYHIAGLTEGLLQTSDGVVRPARLHSSFKAYATMPPEVTAQDKKPVRFDLVVEMPYEEYMAGQESFDKELVRELSEAVFIPEDLVDILDVKEERPGAIEFTMSFSVEPRCLQELGPEVDLLSFGIDTKEGCNLVAPVEYMNELQTQLSNPDSALFYQTDLVMLNKVNADRSFGFSQQFFCSKEPFWQFAAVVLTESECPFDLVKLGGFALVGGTVAVTLVLAVVARLARECGGCIRLAKVRLFDVLTPLMGLYTTAADYAWLIYLQAENAHPLHGTLFLGGLCTLLLCFVVNAAALRMTITTYIVDTPWWRKNRKRLRLILLFSVLSPRFFRITYSHIGSIDRTHIHFGTPSKMAVVFAKLGLATLLQDIPLLLVQLYVWLIWRNLAPKVSLLCFALKAQSIITTVLHHAFSRSQRAAYERVVKLLGLRRLTAGFFDVSAGVGTQAGKGSTDGMRTGGGKRTDELGETFNAEGVLDPTKLDPIQAAMYVAQMYDKKQRNQEDEKEEELSSDSEEGSGSSEGEGDDKAKDASKSQGRAASSGKTLYPPGLYEKMKKFYSLHDPTKLSTIGPGNSSVDEEALDAELKSKFGVGLDSIQ